MSRRSRLALKYYKILGYYPSNIGDHPLKLTFQHRAFWKKVSDGSWEPETFQILQKFLDPESTYCDIGAFIGPTVIFASSRCKKVICFEPDPVAFGYLLTNIQRNNIKNIQAYNLAVTEKTSIIKMSSFGGNLGDSMTSSLDNKKAAESIEAISLSWKNLSEIIDVYSIDLFKIDIEGGEFSLIPAMSKFLAESKPPLWLSTHPTYLPENERQPAIRKLVAALSHYRNCFDSNLCKIDIKALENVIDPSTNQTFLFHE